MSSLLTKILFLILATAYLTGEGVLILLPLVSVPVIGLTVARKSWLRVGALCVALGVGIIAGALIESIPFTVSTLLVWVMILLASILSSIAVGLTLRRYSWSRCLVLTTGAIFIVTTAITMYFWDDLRRDLTISINARIAEIKELEKGQEASDSGGTSDSFVEGLKYLDYHWEDFHLGMALGQSMILALVTMSWMVTRLRVFPTEDGIHYWDNPNLGSFTQVRPPDYLVWLAILVALILIYDQYYNVGEIARIVARNLAVALSFVYWLNGLSILLFCTFLFQWNVILTLIIVLFIFGLWSFPILAIFGFFDTWWEFRNSLLRFYNRISPKTNS